MPDIDTAGLSDEQLYIAYVNETDSMVGRVVDALKQGGQWENTLLVFSSDNGPELRCFDVAKAGYSPAGMLRGMKSELYEGGHCEPFISTWPDHLSAGSPSDQVICLTDLYRTFGALVGDHRPAGMIGGEDSVDFSELFLGKTVDKPLRADLVHHSGQGRFGIRIDDWKYLDWPGSGGYVSPNSNADGTAGQLFHITTDPGEKHNLFATDPDRVARMKASLLKEGAPASAASADTTVKPSSGE